jgi:glyoxylase-like metal-dependent hydrolase (beta-lactamase superfamily II)
VNAEEIAPGIRVVPVRTPTLPPATHTNVWVVGDGEIAVFDPASPWEDEQERLASALLARIDRGERVRWLVLTHHHADHVSGAVALRDQLARHGETPRIVAHPENRRWCPVPIDLAWEDGQTWEIGGRKLTAWHTPGHAPGHLVFHDEASGALVAGDLVAGVGTIAISPIDGDLGQYLASLERARALDASVLLPAHGPALHQAEAVLSFYVAHRHQRSDQIRGALARNGRSTAAELVPLVYPELDPAVARAAEGQIASHLKWMGEHGLATGDVLGWEAR